jgi:hypothetical protein
MFYLGSEGQNATVTCVYTYIGGLGSVWLASLSMCHTCLVYISGCLLARLLALCLSFGRDAGLSRETMLG